jgi:hypothetical protein
MTAIDQKKANIGAKMAEALGLKTVKGYNSVRYQLGHDHATKTAIGVYETVLRLAEDAEKEMGA